MRVTSLSVGEEEGLWPWFSVSGDSEVEILIVVEIVDVPIEQTVRGFSLCKG